MIKDFILKSHALRSSAKCFCPMFDNNKHEIIKNTYVSVNINQIDKKIIFRFDKPMNYLLFFVSRDTYNSVPLKLCERFLNTYECLEPLRTFSLNLILGQNRKF